MFSASFLNQSIKKLFILITTLCVVFCLGGCTIASIENDKNSKAANIFEKTNNASSNTQNTNNQNNDPSEINRITDGREQDGEEFNNLIPLEKERFVIFGVDSRSNELGMGTRSDSIMIVQLDNTNKEIKVCSIYRDCMLHIEDYGYEKVTHAHFYGGPELALDTLNLNLDLNVKEYVTVNFNVFEKFIDELGGIELELTTEEADILSKSYGDHINEEGSYLLNGKETLSYSHLRKASGGDYRRAERQRKVIFEIFNKTKSFSSFKKAEIVSDFSDLVNTSYSKSRLLRILNGVSEYRITAMSSYPQVFYGGTVNGRWVEVPWSLEDMAVGVHGFFEEDDYKPSENVKEYSNYMSDLVHGPNADISEKYGNGMVYEFYE